MGAVIIVGRSCSGKTAVQKELCKRSRYSKVVTCTTRPKRESEVDGMHYHFLSPSDFNEKVVNGEFVETTEYAGDLYGSLRKDLLGDDIKVMVLEPSGASAVKTRLGDLALVVHLNVDPDTCYEAFRGRGDSEEDIRKRMELDDELFANCDKFADVSINNFGFNKSPKEVANIIHQVANIYF